MKKGFSIIAIIIAAAIAITACSKTVQTLSVSELLDLGEKYLLETNYEQALVQFLKVIEIEPKNPRGYTGAAEAYIGLGDTDNAATILHWGLGLLPDDMEIAVMLENVIGSLSTVPDYAIEWEEAAIESLIRTYLNKPSGDIMRSELDHITFLAIWGDSFISVNDGFGVEGWGADGFTANETEYPNGTISNLIDMQHFVNMEGVCVSNNRIEDLSPISGMMKLTQIAFYSNAITDLTPLKNLENLRYVSLHWNQVSDLTPLSGLQNLVRIELSENLVDDISPLANLSGLKGIQMWGNQISDISPLSTMQNLTYLELSGNPIVDWSPVVHIEDVGGRP